MWDVWCATLNLCHNAIRIRIHVTCRIVCRHPAFGRRLVGCPEENPLILAAFLRFLSAPGRNQTWVHNRGQLDRDVQHGSFTYNSHPKKFPFQVEHCFFWRFISILIPKTSCPKRIYVFFFCQVLVHLQLQSGQMKQTCGVIFFGTDVRPCFSSKMETRGKCSEYAE